MEYFIEDVDTNEWYRFPIGEMPTVHSSLTGWDKPDPLNQDYWTKNPLEAFSPFKTKEDAEKFLNEMIAADNLSLCKSDIGFEKRNLIITEHEFVDKCSCRKGIECCDKCSN